MAPLWPGPAVGVSGATAVGLKLFGPPGFAALLVGSTEWLVLVSVDLAPPPQPVTATIAVAATATTTTRGRRIG